MPFAIDPKEIYEYVFSTDRDKPKDQQPALLFHYPTCREQRQIVTLFDDAIDKEVDNDSVALTIEGIRIILCGWKKIIDRKGKPVPYDPEMIEDVLTDTDLIELRVKLLRDMSVGETEKKRLALSLQSDKGKSAKDATAVNASTAPQPQPQQS